MARLPLNMGGYSDDEVTGAFAKSGRVTRFRYELLDDDLTSKAWLKGVVTAKVEYNYNSAIKRTASFTINEGRGDVINYLTDRIRPYIGVQMSDGVFVDVPLGTFVLSGAARTYQGGVVTRAVDGYDLTQVLADDKITSRYVVKKGALYTDALGSLLAPFDTSISDSTHTLPADRSFDPGTPKADMVNILLGAMGYGSIWFDALGVAVCEPYASPSDEPSSWTYATDDESLVGPQSTQTVDLFAVPNVFVRTVTTANSVNLSSKFINSNPNSPTSTVNRGREIVDFQAADSAANQAALDSLTRQAATVASQVYEQVALTTVAIPFHQNRDVYTLVHTGLGISADYSEQGWSMDLTHPALMQSTLQAVVQVDDDSDAS